MSRETAVTLSIDQEFHILSKAKTTQHLTHAQARGIVKLFQYYFKERDSTGRIKRLSKQEKARRWKIYKTKVYSQYNRLIKSEFSSEAALVKRYSDPMSFLKYKLKRYRNLNVSDLKPEDQEYYHEIGGVDDIEEMRRRQANIDSIPKSEQQSLMVAGMDVDQNEVNMQRVLLQDVQGQNDEYQNHNGDNYNQNHNHNHNIQPNQNINQPNTQNFNVQSIPPRWESIIAQQSSQITMEPKIDATLEQIHQNYSEFEKEQMDKKRDVANILTKEKTKAFLTMVTEQMSSKPEIIGMIPGLPLKQQLLVGFNAWISYNQARIIGLGYNKSILCQQLAFLKGDTADTMLFLQHWKMQRIIFEDNFNLVWRFICVALNIKRPSDKEEVDVDQDDEQDEKTEDI